MRVIFSVRLFHSLLSADFNRRFRHDPFIPTIQLSAWANKLLILPTHIGRVSWGFTFLGYTIASMGIVGIVPQTRKRSVERLRRLYEQGASVERIGDYVRRWQRWAVSGRGGLRSLYILFYS